MNRESWGWVELRRRRGWLWGPTRRAPWSGAGEVCGNIVLEMLEGVPEVARDLARTAHGGRLHHKLALGMLSKAIRKLRDMTDCEQYGGAPTVGFDRPVIKAHGRSNARAVRNALKVAAKTIERRLCWRSSPTSATAPPGRWPTRPKRRCRT